MGEVKVKFEGDGRAAVKALRTAAESVRRFNDAWEAALRRQRRLRFAARWWQRPRLWWWRAWYALVDWRRKRRSAA